MKICGNEAAYSLSLQDIQKAAEKRAEEKLSPADDVGRRKRDEYIPAEKETPIGLYEPVSDEEGNPALKFDSPEDDKDGDRKAEDEDKDGDKKAKSEKCTCNTDKVDREIKKLREKAERLEQRLRAADGEKAETLEKELSRVQTELAQKDNDGYRRSQAEFS